jgi:hypothetical protein
VSNACGDNAKNAMRKRIGYYFQPQKKVFFFIAMATDIQDSVPVQSKSNRAHQLVVLKPGNELPLVRSAIPMGKINGERMGFWDKWQK